ncbi:S-layer homology domain-containing protein [Paenibacillus sp. BC26]|nr:S-layer homology domain-containing protein [Paenibacillus sp. BC26]
MRGRLGNRIRPACLMLLIILISMFLNPNSAKAASTSASIKDVDRVVADTAAFMLSTVKDPQVGSVGGEWAIIGLARSGYTVPQRYYDDYYSHVEQVVTANRGVLSEKKHTEYSRLILALRAIGADPANVAGYNLLMPLGDYDKTVWQGINGPIFALLALDSGNYEIPFNKSAGTHATREMYIDDILSQQLKDGGFALSGIAADPDVTGMAIQALAKYQNRTSVKAAIEKAIQTLSRLQDDDGGYASLGVKNVESTVQVLMALCELGMPLDDSRFAKNGKTILDNLLTYYTKGQGFRHNADGSGVTGMSTEQALYGLVNYQRAAAGRSSLYRMNDVASLLSTNHQANVGLPNKHKDVQVMPVVESGKTFSDIREHANKTAIEALAARGIISGINATTFAPNQSMTRAEFAAVMTKGLGLKPKATNAFKDITPASWYSGAVGTAYAYGIVKGTSTAAFSPNRTISKQEAAVMIANAAKLCGMNTALGTLETRDMLAQFGDYTKTAEWARAALAFNYRENILSQDVWNIEPTAAVKRAEIADMLYRMLIAAKLL